MTKWHMRNESQFDGKLKQVINSIMYDRKVVI
jgi:hypothetical protein